VSRAGYEHNSAHWLATLLLDRASYTAHIRSASRSHRNTASLETQHSSSRTISQRAQTTREPESARYYGAIAHCSCPRYRPRAAGSRSQWQAAHQAHCCKEACQHSSPTPKNRNPAGPGEGRTHTLWPTFAFSMLIFKPGVGKLGIAVLEPCIIKALRNLTVCSLKGALGDVETVRGGGSITWRARLWSPVSFVLTAAAADKIEGGGTTSSLPMKLSRSTGCRAVVFRMFWFAAAPLAPGLTQ
jgi:hypothetical protein